MKPTISIILSGITAGILDGMAAVIFLGKMNFVGVWKYVASGYFGKSAFSGGNEMVVFGLLFHFSIAIFWATFYFFFLYKISFFRKHTFVGGLLFGVLIWTIMNLVVLPFTNIPQSPLTVIGAVKNMVVLIICVGLPISLIQKRLRKYGN